MSTRADGPGPGRTGEWRHGRERGPAPPTRGGGTASAPSPLLPPIRRRKRDTGDPRRTTTGERGSGGKRGNGGSEGAPVRRWTGAPSARSARAPARAASAPPAHPSLEQPGQRGVDVVQGALRLEGLPVQ